jgi:hypothetical protein
MKVDNNALPYINLEYDPDADGERSAQAEEDIQAAVEYYRRWVAVPPTEGNELSPPIPRIDSLFIALDECCISRVDGSFLERFSWPGLSECYNRFAQLHVLSLSFQLGDLDDPKFQAAWLMEKFALALSGRNSGETSVVLTEMFGGKMPLLKHAIFDIHSEWPIVSLFGAVASTSHLTLLADWR